MFQVKQKKARKLVLGDDAADFVVQYRELFPKGNLPSGTSARAHVRELTTKFTWFFNTYTYDWPTIIEATRRYIESYEATGFMYMKNSSYFISKQDKERGITSELATKCDQLLEGDDTDQQEHTIKMR